MKGEKDSHLLFSRCRYQKPIFFLYMYRTQGVSDGRVETLMNNIMVLRNDKSSCSSWQKTKPFLVCTYLTTPGGQKVLVLRRMFLTP